MQAPLRTFTPLPHQRLAIDHLETHDRAALFVGCGLGKTACCIDVIARLGLRALVVAPLRVAQLTWPDEVARWQPGMSINLFRATGRIDPSAQVNVVNYDQLQKLGNHLAKHPQRFDVVIWDESTRAKNPSSKRIRAVLKHLARTPRRWILTGTPAPNSLLDLWGQIRLLDDGAALGKSYHAYRARYFRPTGYGGYTWVIRDGAEARIHEAIKPYTLTLTASEWLGLPDIVEEDIDTPLPREAASVYRELERDMLAEINNTEVSAVTAAALVNKLLQVTGGNAYDDEGNAVALHDAKLDALAKLAKSNGPLLVAANYRHEVERILTLPGAEPFSEAILPRWNAGKVKMLVANPASIGHGLNLQKGGNTVVWYSPTWSRELYDQFNARLHRTGQRDGVKVMRLLAPGTVDDAVIATLSRKERTQNALLQAVNNVKRMAKK